MLSELLKPAELHANGGIGGEAIRIVECETGYKHRDGVECYESTKVKALSDLPAAAPLQYVSVDPGARQPMASASHNGLCRHVGRRWVRRFNWDQLLPLQTIGTPAVL